MLANFVAYIIDKYGPIKGKKAFQKIFYFLTEMGIPTNLQYSLYHYGPYSEQLEIESSKFQSIGIIDIKKEGYGYTIYESIFTKEYASSCEIESYISKIDIVIDKLPITNPLKLELYSTTHYATNVISKIYDKDNIDEVVKEVKSIKKQKFTDEEIKEAYNYLKENRFYFMLENN